jgi:hypothetical protein
MARLVSALVVLLAFSGCSISGDDDQGGTINAEFVVELVRLGSEKSAGTVGLSAEPGGKTRVEIVLLEPATGQRVEIRGGNCDVIDSAAAYSLAPLVEGRSQSVVDAYESQLRRAGYLVLVHDAAGIGGVCGNLARSKPAEAAPTFE